MNGLIGGNCGVSNGNITAYGVLYDNDGGRTSRNSGNRFARIAAITSLKLTYYSGDVRCLPSIDTCAADLRRKLLVAHTEIPRLPHRSHIDIFPVPVDVAHFHCSVVDMRAARL